MDKNLEKFLALLEDPEQASKILASTVEETQKNLESIGIYLSITQLNEIASGARNTAKNSSELDEKMLETVSGGAKSEYYNAGYKFGKMLRQLWNLLSPLAE